MASTITTVGQSDGIYDEKIRIVSKTKVALRAFKKRTERIVGGIYIREEADMNQRLNKYEIMSIGSEAKKETGLDVGDVVYADALARFYDTFPVSVIRYDSIIFKGEKDSENISPLNGNLFVTMDKLEEENKLGIICLTDLLPVGTVTDINKTGIKNCNLNVGDKVLLLTTENMALVTFAGKRFYIYKHDEVSAIVEKE